MSRPHLLASKVCIITGGATGIGRAIALGFLEHGARGVAVNHLGDERSRELFQGMLDEAAQRLDCRREDVETRMVEVGGDVGDPETGKRLVGKAVEEWGRVDICVSNAGICEFKEFLE